MAEELSSIFDLTGKTAIVTGGYGHLGAAMVKALAAFNATVIVAGRNEDKFTSVFTQKEESLVIFEFMDITSSDSINKCLASVFKKFQRIDILVNNAQTAKGQSQAEMSDDDWAYTMDGVVGSVHKTIRAAIPVMKTQGSGKIINISSMYGIVSPDFSIYQGDGCEVYINPPHYGAAKAAMIQLTRYYAVLLGKYNIQVNTISPGPFPSQRIQEENPVFVERLRNKNPLRKIGRPDDLAGILVLLSSGSSDFITGQNLQVDGGWTIW